MYDEMSGIKPSLPFFFYAAKTAVLVISAMKEMSLGETCEGLSILTDLSESIYENGYLARIQAR